MFASAIACAPRVTFAYIADSAVKGQSSNSPYCACVKFKTLARRVPYICSVPKAVEHFLLRKKRAVLQVAFSLAGDRPNTSRLQHALRHTVHPYEEALIYGDGPPREARLRTPRPVLAAERGRVMRAHGVAFGGLVMVLARVPLLDLANLRPVYT